MSTATATTTAATTTPPALLFSALDTAPGAASLQQQLLARLRQAVLDQSLAAGSRLPASRQLSEQLQISRNTVLAVYAQLVAEGFAVADRQGTRVAAVASAPTPTRRLPVLAPLVGPLAGVSMAAPVIATTPAATTPAAADRLRSMAPSRDAGDRSLPLTPGMPALSRFPLGAWLRAQERALRRAPSSVLGYGEALGEPALRAAIAQYLRVARGVRCEPAQVVVTEGAQGALSLCVRLFANPGDVAWHEQPGYGGARAAFLAGDLQPLAMAVDAEGIVIPEHSWRTRPARLIHVTPSHQYPMGAVLSLSRRLALIEHARAAGSWIIEDDYDSEFRHRGQPVAAMQGLQPQAPVLYVGTFSKTMFPALRIGFLVLPEGVGQMAQTALGELLRGGHRLEQLALAEFIDSGQFARHLGRMRRLYRERQQALRAAIAAHIDVPHVVLGGDGGLHLTLRLAPGTDDAAISAAARRAGMNVGALSSFAVGAAPDCNGLVIGYGDTPVDRFAPLMQRLAALWRRQDQAENQT